MLIRKPSPIPLDWERCEVCGRCNVGVTLNINDVHRVGALHRLYNRIVPTWYETNYWNCPHCGKRNYLISAFDDEIDIARDATRLIAKDRAVPCELEAAE